MSSLRMAWASSISSSSRRPVAMDCNGPARAGVFSAHGSPWYNVDHGSDSGLTSLTTEVRRVLDTPEA